MVKKRKLLFYGDSPCIETGFAQVTKNVLSFLKDDFDITINPVSHYFKEYDHEKFPYNIFPSNPQEPLNLRQLRALLADNNFDIFFAQMDYDIMYEMVDAIKQTKKPFVFYFPIDAENIPPETMDAVTIATKPIVYSKFGQKTLKKLLNIDVDYIPLGFDPDFFPMQYSKRQELKKKYFGFVGDRFIFANFNRNQWRKDMGRTMGAFKEFDKKYPDKARLYLHCQKQDMGGSVYWQARSLGIDSKVIFTPDSFSVQQGVTRPVLGEMFNAVDANISTTTGEGWGLTTVEAMAVKSPVLMPDNTTMPEIVGENGYLHKSELDYSFAYGSSNIARPRSNINSLVKDMESVYKDWNKGKYTGQTREKIIKARESIKQYEWANLKDRWINLFKEM